MTNKNQDSDQNIWQINMGQNFIRETNFEVEFF